ATTTSRASPTAPPPRPRWLGWRAGCWNRRTRKLRCGARSSRTASATRWRCWRCTPRCAAVPPWAHNDPGRPPSSGGAEASEHRIPTRRRVLPDDPHEVERPRERDVEAHLALAVRHAAQIGDDHGGSFQALEAQERVADDRARDPRVVGGHDVVRSEARAP